MAVSRPLSPPARVLLLDLGRESSLRHACLADLALALSKLADFSPVLAAPASSPLCAMAREQGLEHCALPSALAWDPRSLSRLSCLVPADAPCLVHSHDAGGAALAAALTRRLTGALMLHTLYSAPAPGKARRKDAWRKAHTLIAVSEFLRDACRHAELDLNQIHRIRPGLDPQRCPQRQERGDGRLVFLAAAPENSRAGWETLLKALPYLEARSDLPPWELRIAGKSAHFPALLDLAKNLGVEKRLALFGGHNHHNFLSQADVLLAPSENELEGLAAIQQAWAADLPVIAPGLPTSLELLVSGKNALVYPAANAGALAEHMARLALDQALRDVFALAGRVSLTAVTAARAAEEHGRLYRELLEART